MRKIVTVKSVLIIISVLVAAFAWLVHWTIAEIVKSNEATVIQTLIDVSGAQLSWAEASYGSYFTDLECLADPGGCVPDYPGRPLLDLSVALAEVKHGYRFVFVPRRGTEAEWRDEVNRLADYYRKNNLPPLDPDRVPDGYIDFAYMAIPENRYIAGTRGFCMDGVGQVWVYLPEELDLLRYPDPSNPCPETASQCRGCSAPM